MGKALGVYCPLTATIFSERVAAVFEKHIFGHGQSYAGHALGAAATLASLEVLLDDGLLDQAAERGAVLGQSLKELGERHSCVGDVRGLGLFWTVEIVQDRAAKTPVRRSTEKYSDTIVKDLAGFLLDERDIYVPSDKFGLWVVPPLIVTDEEIQFLVAGLDAALDRADHWLATR
jgi:taurine--2-oxoglutarate transaminase